MCLLITSDVCTADIFWPSVFLQQHIRKCIFPHQECKHLHPWKSGSSGDASDESLDSLGCLNYFFWFSLALQHVGSVFHLLYLQHTQRQGIFDHRLTYSLSRCYSSCWHDNVLTLVLNLWLPTDFVVGHIKNNPYLLASPTPHLCDCGMYSSRVCGLHSSVISNAAFLCLAVKTPRQFKVVEETMSKQGR